MDLNKDNYSKDEVATMLKDGKGFSQDDVNRFVQERLARDRDNYKDYDDLKKFKDDFDKNKDVQTQKGLEDAKKYDEAKANYAKQITDLQGIVTAKDQSIQGMNVNYALTNALLSQNAYVEESLAMLKSSVVIADDGTMSIKGKDANNIDTQLTIEEGIKQFLAKKPHLVKANPPNGGGTPPGGPGGGSGDSTTDLMKLNQEYLTAKMSGDGKRAAELREKIQGNFSSRGIQRSM